MRVRTPIASCLIVAVCIGVAVFGWYQDRPRRFVVHGGTLGVGATTKADATAHIIWHGATLQTVDGMKLEVIAFVRDLSGATIRCTLADFPSEGGTKELTGDSGQKIVSWRSIEIDRATWISCALGLRPAPKYTLVYSTPRSARWTGVSIFALVAGPTLAASYWAAARLMRRIGDARPGFEVLSPEGRQRGGD